MCIKQTKICQIPPKHLSVYACKYNCLYPADGGYGMPSDARVYVQTRAVVGLGFDGYDRSASYVMSDF